MSPDPGKSVFASTNQTNRVVPPEAIASSGWATAMLRSLSSSKRGSEGVADAAEAASVENAKDRDGEVPAANDEEEAGVTEARVRR